MLKAKIVNGIGRSQNKSHHLLPAHLGKELYISTAYNSKIEDTYFRLNHIFELSLNVPFLYRHVVEVSDKRIKNDSVTSEVSVF